MFYENLQKNKKDAYKIFEIKNKRLKPWSNKKTSLS